MKFLRCFYQLEAVRIFLVSFVPGVFDHCVPAQDVSLSAQYGSDLARLALYLVNVKLFLVIRI